MSERLAATLEGPDGAPVVALGTSIGTSQGLWDHGAQIASTIPGARFTVVRGAAHLASYEAPGEITAALQAHLAPLL